jgi:acetyl esterase/lipase
VATVQADQLAEFFAAVGKRTKPDLDVVTRRDILERMHLCSSEPEAVTYAEVDAGGVPAMWCIPAGCDDDTVMMWNHAGGTVVFSMHSDRKTAGHLAKAAGIRALVLDFRHSPENKFPAQQDDVEFAGRAKAAGLDVGLHSIPAGQHLFLLGAGRVPETDAAITEMGRWLRSKLGLGLAALPVG